MLYQVKPIRIISATVGSLIIEANNPTDAALICLGCSRVLYNEEVVREINDKLAFITIELHAITSVDKFVNEDSQGLGAEVIYLRSGYNHKDSKEERIAQHLRSDGHIYGDCDEGCPVIN